MRSCDLPRDVLPERAPPRHPAAMRSHVRGALAAAALLVTPAACSGAKEVCAPRSPQACVCPDGSRGERVCAADGAQGAPCTCAPPASAGPPQAAPESSAVADAAALRRIRDAECGALTQVINEAVDDLERSSEAGDDQDAKIALLAMADRMDEIAADAAQLKLTIRELQKLSSEYQAMAKDIARAARELATAADANDMDRSSAAQIAVEDAISQEDPIIDRLNRFCQAR